MCSSLHRFTCSAGFFFTNTTTPRIYTLPLHDALPIYQRLFAGAAHRLRGRRTDRGFVRARARRVDRRGPADRKSTRLNSSHLVISYAVFCLKKNNEHANGSAELSCIHHTSSTHAQGT